MEFPLNLRGEPESFAISFSFSSRIFLCVFVVFTIWACVQLKSRIWSMDVEMKRLNAIRYRGWAISQCKFTVSVCHYIVCFSFPFSFVCKHSPVYLVASVVFLFSLSLDLLVFFLLFPPMVSAVFLNSFI